MNIKLRLLGEQVLIVFNIFVLFLLLFDNKLVLPYWLQSAGRLHTLLLHFPIVILILAIGMDLFRFSGQKNSTIFFINFSRSLLLTGVLLAGITVILGLFLSREEGYAGDTLQWHKWTGAGIFFMASIIYRLRNKLWYKAPAAWCTAFTMISSLIITGHYGATLTHGENFILQPITSTMQKPPVPLDQAIVFNDVIQPILEKKCTGCHNPHKLKGEMVLTDTLSIMKGGKSGKLFVPGNTAISLLLERVHLPLEEEEHMPPAGKPQLTADEIILLSLWIKAKASFTQKVIALPGGDSLRLLATSVLKPVVDSEALFNFPPADEKTIATLNTDYRTVAHQAKESPALDVSIYNMEAYSIKQLQELDEIKKQVVSLSLNKLPVKDEDLITISRFENLRRLELNFTDITVRGLQALTSLKHLHTLSLSGTKVSYPGLKETLTAFKTLKTIAVWNTELSSVEIAQLQQDYKNITFIEGFKNDGKEPLKLNPPQVKNSTMIFADTIPVQLRHPIRGAEIRYTTDGSEPDSIRSPVFDNHTWIGKNTTIKAKAYKAGWFTSDVAV
ncbi:MAG: Planctomycete cytochrome, partial [Chitinophagaceae bacterium]|nr:Planctomycete cytochrome [Chitinophagaceae bacterium]